MTYLETTIMPWGKTKLRRILTHLSEHKMIYIFSVCFFFYLLWLQNKINYLPNIITQGDGAVYLNQAKKFASGIVPRDPYRPLLFQLLVGWLYTLFGDYFLAGKLISIVSSVLLLIYVYFIAQQYFSRFTGYFTIAAFASSVGYQISSIIVLTDPLASLLNILTIYYCLKFYHQPTNKNILFTALWFSLSYFTRYTSLALVPMIVLAIIFSESTSRKKIKIAVLFVLYSIIFSIPNFYLTYAGWGEIIHNENWRNLALKLYGQSDFEFTRITKFNSYFNIILYSPKRFFLSLIHELVIYLRLYGGFPLLIIFICLITLYLKNRNPRSIYIFENYREKILLSVFMVSYILMVCATFYAKNYRIVFPTQIPLYIFLGYTIHVLLKALRFDKALMLYGLVVVVIAINIGNNFHHRLVDFKSMIPLDEYRTALLLQERHGKKIRVLGTNSFIATMLDIKYAYYHIRFNHTSDIRKKTFAKDLFNTVAKYKPEYFLTGRISTRAWKGEKLNLPDYMIPFIIEKDVQVYKIDYQKYSKYHLTD